MKIIKRFDLLIEPMQRLDVPFNAEILHFGLVGDRPGFWALIDPTQRSMERIFVMVGAGKDISDRMNKTSYVGSFEHKAEVGSRMVHIFEET
jgi:hypothetical protein